MNLIDVKNLLFKYKMYSGEKEEVIEHTAIDNISLSIKKGDFVGILGHNGSGKSTLAKQLAALLKPSGGIIYVGGMDTAKEEQILDIRKTAGLVFQNPDNQLIGNIVEEDVAFGPENMGIPAEEIEMRITKALASTGMTAYREASPGALSGGQKQKIAISGVLAMEPECIIFDEPTAMIDPESRKELLEAIYDLKRLKNITVIYITHFLQEVSQADYLYVMSHGKITLKGTPETLFKIPEKLVENNLELPFEVALIDGLRKKSVDVPEEIYTKQQLLEFLKYHFQKDKSDNIVLSEYKSERKTISESSKSNVKSQAKENSRYGNSMEKQSDSHSISVDDRNEKLLYFSNKPESDSKFEKVYHVIEYTPEIEAIFQIYCPQMPDLDWEFWKNELMGTKMWEDADIDNYKRKIFKYDFIQSVHFLPIICALKLASNYYVPVVMLVGAIAFTYSPFVKKWHNKVKELTREYQRAALCQLIAERCT